ncbi:MAG TPA: acyl-CoA dehydrogenase family protein [Candidatus Binataceae bacterium]|nr:acyl-CoA dehydrogenase family protein [Candidatus Binataceae bacterium]
MISFELSDEQKMVRDTVAAFAADEIRPPARLADETGSFPPELIAKAWELGLVRGALPENLGGYGDARSAVTGAIVAEELAYGDLAFALHAMAPRLMAFPVLEMGTDQQRERYLKPLAADHFVAATAALMEPDYDFDPASMRTVARLDSGEFVIDGRKCWVPLAADSAVILVYVAIRPEDGFGGVDGFIVPRDAPGLRISEREKQMGLKGLATFELAFEGCRVPAEARLGGDRGINFTRLLSESRVAMAASAVGVARAAFDYARDYAKERKAFGVPIATKQAIAFMLAEMAIEVDAMRLMVWEAASLLDKGHDALKESYQARNYTAAAALMVADNAVQTLGGHGYIREHPVELWLRNARAFAILDGLAIV